MADDGDDNDGSDAVCVEQAQWNYTHTGIDN